MKNLIAATLLTSFGLCASPALAESLNELDSACRAGDSVACSAYNAAVFADVPVLVGGYDPFAIVPATHVESTPKLPTAETDQPTLEGEVTAVVVQSAQ